MIKGSILLLQLLPTVQIKSGEHCQEKQRNAFEIRTLVPFNAITYIFLFVSDNNAALFG